MIDTNIKSVVIFQREKAQDCFAEAIPLLVEHGRELKYFQDFKLEPEFSRYEQMESTGVLRTYCARKDNRIVGYAVFFISPHLHFKSKIFALCDILYILPEHRGFGLSFLRWCNDRLRFDGADVIYYYVNKRFDYGPILRRLGFKHTDDLYSSKF